MTKGPIVQCLVCYDNSTALLCLIRKEAQQMCGWMQQKIST